MKEDASVMGEPPRSLVVWLGGCVLMVATMMLIGAITRLTESGLSMVEWRPLIGALPPLSASEWERVFELYRNTSEYRLENAGMSLSEFQSIFWWEYIHRLWGRLIGAVYGLPLIFFIWRGHVSGRLRAHLLILLVLGGAQGVIGWWMVKSGFVDRHDVSQYRLVVHLSMAFFILGYMLWLMGDLVFGAKDAAEPASIWVRRTLSGVIVLVFVTMMSGGLVAGLGAGFTYNTWPLIEGAVIPEALFESSSGAVAIFEDILTVQFNHRMLAYATCLAVLSIWMFSRHAPQTIWQRRVLLALALTVIGQILLGIATLLSVVAPPIAVLHQAGAILLFSLSVLARHAFR